MRAPLCRLGSILFLCIGLAATALAKDKPLVGIVLYDTPAGPAYVQAADVTLNGKPEVLTCIGDEKLDNNGYKRLPKSPLSAALIVERDSAGLLRMTTSGGTTCIVPANLKLEKKTVYLPKDLAAMAVLGGRVISKSANGADVMPAEFKPGTRIQFVAVADDELAEYLRVSRTPAIALWGEYLKQYPAAAHSNEVKNALAGMITAEGESALAAFKRSQDDKAPKYELLRAAKAKAAEARKVISFVRAEKLSFDADALVQSVLVAARNELGAFQRAVSDRTSGFEHLKKAQALAENVRTVDPAFPQLGKLLAETDTQMQLMEKATAAAEGLIGEGKFDQAFAAIQRYAPFAPELPRVAAVVDAAAKSHREKGQDLMKESRWEEAVIEFQRSLDFKQDAQTAAVLKNAQSQLDTLKSKDLAQKAIENTAPMITAKQFVEAFESLEALPDAQRQFVTEDMEKLRPEYLNDLVTRANNLTRVHIPIRGRGDEDAVRQAYTYLMKATKLSEEEAVKVKLEVIGEKISEYYLAQANRLLEKPRGSGVGLGWQMLQEGQRYKTDLETLRNQITKFAPAYQTRGKLSIAVQFRDQTSRRDSLGFADQMADTIASRLENSGIRGIHVLTRERFLAQADPNSPAPANFLLIGDIVQHRVDKKTDVQRLNSKYRAGTREVKNPAWLEANRQLDALQKEYERSIEASKLVIARNKKREIAEVNRLLEEAGHRVEDQKKKLESIPETLLQDIIQPYSYTKRTIILNALVEVAFRASDNSVESAKQSDSVKIELPKSVNILENVKPEDTEGIVEEGTPPDDLQMLAEAETRAQEEIMKKLTEWVKEVPVKVLEDARERAARKDMEGAAERYILYLNSTTEQDSPERQEAASFLRNEFNITLAKAEQ